MAEQKLEETVRRLKDGGNSVEAGAGARKDMSDMVAYKTMDDIPYSRELIIQVFFIPLQPLSSLQIKVGG